MLLLPYTLRITDNNTKIEVGNGMSWENVEKGCGIVSRNVCELLDGNSKKPMRMITIRQSTGDAKITARQCIAKIKICTNRPLWTFGRSHGCPVELPDWMPEPLEDYWYAAWRNYPRWRLVGLMRGILEKADVGDASGLELDVQLGTASEIVDYSPIAKAEFLRLCDLGVSRKNLAKHSAIINSEYRKLRDLTKSMDFFVRNGYDFSKLK